MLCNNHINCCGWQCISRWPLLTAQRPLWHLCPPTLTRQWQSSDRFEKLYLRQKWKDIRARRKQIPHTDLFFVGLRLDGCLGRMYQHLLLSDQDVGSKRMTFIWGVVYESDGLSQTSGCLSLTEQTMNKRLKFGAQWGWGDAEPKTIFLKPLQSFTYIRSWGVSALHNAYWKTYSQCSPKNHTDLSDLHMEAMSTFLWKLLSSADQDPSSFLCCGVHKAQLQSSSEGWLLSHLLSSTGSDTPKRQEPMGGVGIGISMPSDIQIRPDQNSQSQNYFGETQGKWSPWKSSVQVCGPCVDISTAESCQSVQQHCRCGRLAWSCNIHGVGYQRTIFQQEPGAQ